MHIGNDEFNDRFEKYLKENGPNPGVGYISKHGWWFLQRRSFIKQLEQQGYDIDHL